MKSTFHLKSAWILLNLTIRAFEHFVLETGLKLGQKHSFNLKIQKLKGIDRDLRLSIPKESSEIVFKEITDNWDNQAIFNVLHLMAELPDSKKLEIEEQVGKIYDEYLKSQDKK